MHSEPPSHTCLHKMMIQDDSIPISPKNTSIFVHLAGPQLIEHLPIFHIYYIYTH
jgi:hypothetical protein